LQGDKEVKHNIPGRASDSGPDPKPREMDLWEKLDEAREALHTARTLAAGVRHKGVDASIRLSLNTAALLIESAKEELL
jgi:hypothetical protein